jgi:hypothetical protein
MDSEQTTIFGYMWQHPKTWTVCAIFWVLSCLIFWKLQLVALDRSQRAGYTLYHTPKSLDTKPPNPKNLPWYLPQIGTKLTPEFKDLLERYANVPVEEQEAYIKKIVSEPTTGNMKVKRGLLTISKARCCILHLPSSNHRRVLVPRPWSRPTPTLPAHPPPPRLCTQ